MELRAMARAAKEQFDKDQAESREKYEREEESRRVESLRSALNKTIGEELAATIVVDGPRVTVDGVTLEAIDYRYLAIIGLCPECGAEVRSDPIRSLAQLGERLAPFTPDGYHWYDCRARRAKEGASDAAVEESLNDRLVAIVREIAREEAGC